MLAMIGWMPWHDSIVLAAVSAVLAVVCRKGRLRPVGTWARELTLMFLLYSLWQYASDLSIANLRGAMARGRDIWNLERDIGLPKEGAIQRPFLGDHELLRLANFYYAWFHVTLVGVCLVWLFARHRRQYWPVRTLLVVVTGLSLLVQLLAVAPPRLEAGFGVVDVGRLVGPDTYPNTIRPGLDQLSAMPSLHVGWAIVVAVGVILGLRSRWRWLAVLYPFVTLWVVIVTGNHYWADGIVAALLCAVAALIIWPLRRRLGLDPSPGPTETGTETLSASGDVRP